MQPTNIQLHGFVSLHEQGNVYPLISLIPPIKHSKRSSLYCSKDVGIYQSFNIIQDMELPSARLSSSSKKQKNPPRKRFLYFRKWNFLAPTVNNLICFRKRNFLAPRLKISYMFGNRTF